MAQGKQKRSLLDFVRQVRQETGRVSWPRRQEVVLTSVLVVVMVFLFALFFLCVDQSLAFVVRFVLGWGGSNG